MKKRKVGTVTLAASLIAIGALLFARNFIDIDLKQIMSYWPVLLIGLGLEMVLHMALQKDEDSNTRVGVDGLCVVLIIFLALFSSGAKIFDIGFPFHINLDGFEGSTVIDGIRYDSQVEADYLKENISANQAVSIVKVDNPFGEVKILQSNTQGIKIEAEVKVKYNDRNGNKDKALQYAKDAVGIREGTTTEIYTKAQPDADKNDYAKAQIDYIIYVPENVSVEIYNKFGDVEAEAVKCSIMVDNKYGDTTLKDIEGNVEVDNAFGGIDVKGVKGEVELDTAFGSLDASDITGSLAASSKNGKLTIENITGKTDLEASFGSIDVKSVEGALYAESKNGSIDARDIMGSTKLYTSFGSIKLDSANVQNGDIFAETSMGSINTGLSLNVQKSGTKSTAEGRLGSGQYQIELKSSNGSIDIN